MAIPCLTEGCLPPGIHDCSLEDIRASFGTSQRREILVRNLSRYIQNLRQTGFAGWIIVDGSFATDKENPTDVDIVLAIGEDCNYSILAPVTRLDYTLLNDEYVRRNFGIHLFIGFTDGASRNGFDDAANSAIECFTQVKGRPGAKKGHLRMAI